MPKIVEVPGVGNVEFPETMADADISKIIVKQTIKNPSDAIPKAKAPISPELQGSAPSRLSQALANLPYSAIRSVQRLATGPQMGGISRDSQGRIDLNAGLHPLIDSIKQRSLNPLVDAAIDDPISAAQNIQALARGGEEGQAGARLSGASRQIPSNARNVLDKFSLWHPLKNVGTLYDAGVNIAKGASDAANPPKTSPFDIRQVRTPPSSGGMPFSPKTTGIEGSVVEQPWKRALGIPDETNPFASKPVESTGNRGGNAIEPTPTNIEGTVTDVKPSNIEGLPEPGNTGSPKLAKQLLKSTPSKEVRSVARPGIVGKDLPQAEDISGPNESDIPGGQDPNASKRLGKQLIRKVKSLGSDTSGEFQGHPKVWRRLLQGEPNPTVPIAAAETRAVQPLSSAGTQVPEQPANGPSAFPISRPVIRDEHGNALMYSDTKAPDIDQPSQEIRPVQRQSPMDKPYQQMQNARAVDESKNPDDVYTQMANEGMSKRIADSKNKYEDVYNTHIKGQMTPDEVRSLGTDPVAKTAMDMKIKAMKFPSDHPKAGQKKYSSGLNPAMVDTLANRLESEQP